ncbi:hypothetical protein SNEBB_001696 [Seison nebaliae]|nr:hypothetical protein SNEBB_001696 [Seison nebaliae]
MKNILIYGGRGSLGRTIIEHFVKVFSEIKVVSVDIAESVCKSPNVQSIVIKEENRTNLQKQFSCVNSNIEEFVEKNGKFQAIINVAGGWAGGNAKSETFVQSGQCSIEQSIWSSIIAAHLATKYLLEDKRTFLLLPAAAIDLKNGTPTMIGYGCSKAAVIHMTKSLAHNSSGLPDKCRVYALAPIILDTIPNRNAMPNGDTSSWTPLSFVSEMLEKWVKEEKEMPLVNGSVLKLKTENNITQILFE